MTRRIKDLRHLTRHGKAFYLAPTHQSFQDKQANLDYTKLILTKDRRIAGAVYQLWWTDGNSSQFDRLACGYVGIYHSFNKITAMEKPAKIRCTSSRSLSNAEVHAAANLIRQKIQSTKKN
jgi:hypothetical protein